MTATNLPAIVDISSPDPAPDLLGGKAASLARLAAAGLPVPQGAVVPTYVADDDLEAVAAALADRLAGSPLAVRSSGVAEDLADASFAGQYETVLNVSPAPGPLCDAIRRVRASATRPHVASYGGDTDRRMAVLVMPMVPASAAGIAFSRNPVSGRNDVVIEAVAGLADQLAAGEVTGERWTCGDHQLCQNGTGVLKESQAGAIADLARRVEALEGRPQDIEWAIADDALVLLQARPITTLDDIEPMPYDEEPPRGPWVWDSTHSRAPMTPLTSSVFTPGFTKASRFLVEHFGAPFDRLEMATIDGYVYLQVVPPVGKPGAPPPPPAIAKLLFRLIPAMRRRERTARKAFANRTDLALLNEWKEEAGPAIEATLDGWWDQDLAQLSDAELADRLLEAAELQRTTFRWNMITDPAYLLPLSELYDFVDLELSGDMETIARLLAGASTSEYRGSLRSLETRLTPQVRDAIAAGDGDPVDRLAHADPAFADAYRQHLRRHGTRIFGFDLAVPTLAEDPQAELSRLVALAPDTDATPDAELLAAELRSRLDEEAAGRFDRLLETARATYPIREEGEAVHSRVMGALRFAALELGRRMEATDHLDDADHVVFLTLEEALSWLADRSDHRAPVRTRRANLLWAKGHTPPATIGGEDAPPELSVFPKNIARVMKIFTLVLAHDARPASLEAGADGVAASPGTHTGPVRIVHGPEEFGKVLPGDVLVAPITTSPWELLFPTIGALVTEGGGLLSHPAIVAREYRIPAVVGCEDATGRLHDGQLVTVDGTAGTVTPVMDR
ncbi:MAG: PEP/pyruvate-binding domain-containing protein [Acidimicrobiia bacterium]